MATTYQTFQSILNNNFGSVKFYKRSYCNTLAYTEGIMDFQKQLNAFWFVDNVVSYMPNIIDVFKKTEDTFYIITINIDNSNKGFIEIYREGYLDNEYSNHIQVLKQDIEFIDLPVIDNEENTEYKFYLCLDSYQPLRFTLMLPSEY